jgi:putative transposase
MLNATKIRIYPTNKQAQSLSVQFGHARWAYNNALAKTQELYRATGKGLNYHAMAIRLPKLKKEFEWLKEADAQVLQQSLQHLARAFENFFAKRGKYPRFKLKHDRQSIQYPQRVKINGSRIYLPKVGWVKCVVHREIIGRMKTVTVSRNACGQLFASVLTDNDIALPEVSTEGKAIGIDVGLTHLAITSNGSKFDNPRHIRKSVRNLKRKQQSLSRKVKGSNSRNKARKLVARAHERISCARKDYLHKLSRKIVNENQVIAVETLNVKGMTKNHKLAKAISDASWGTLINFLEYKSARAGKAFVKIDRWFPSSKACSSCGAVCDKLPLNVRAWTCPHCGTTHDRDINAAINIRDEGLRILAGGTPVNADRGKVSHGKKNNLSAVLFPLKSEAPAFRMG